MEGWSYNSRIIQILLWNNKGNGMRKFEFVPEGTVDCNVRVWLHETEKAGEKVYPAVVICPGGGYGHVSEREAEPIARVYYEAGYHTFILNYSVGNKAKGFKPLCQLAGLIAHVRKYANEWNVNPNQIAACGFSAGGHLVASLGTLYKHPKFLEVFGRDDLVRPDAMILAYPVILADEYAHVGSLEAVSGAACGSKEYAWFGLDQYVDTKTPPAYLWHTAEDTCVPVENSLKMAMALSKAKVPFEYHVFPYGKHGMSCCTEEVGTPSEYNARWMEWSIRWLEKMFL